MTRKRGMATAFAAACLVLAGCAGPLNLMQESIYCDDARIAQGFDTYTVANRTGSLFDRKIGGLTGLETWLRISVPNEGGEFRVDYDATVSDGDFKIVFVDEKNVDTVCEGTGRVRPQSRRGACECRNRLRTASERRRHRRCHG